MRWTCCAECRSEHVRCATPPYETMKVLSERWKPIAFFFCLALVALTLITVKTRLVPHISFFESWIVSAVMPLQEAVSGGIHSVQNIWDSYINLIHVRRENSRLQQQVEALQGQLHRYQEAYLQQQRLQEVLDFRASTFPKALAAEVVGIDPSQWAEAITINKGQKHGVQKDVAIVTPHGLVGRTIEVAPRYAAVLLITDRRSAVDALVQRTRARGIVVGKSRRLTELRYVDFHEDIRVGDQIISSGLGDVYPKGLLIGTVSSVRAKPYGLFHEVEVQPAVDLAKLEEVLVLVP
jgi:rod shape-determining protein MreC